MALRCLLFSSDQGTAELICQVLAGLGVEGESCSEGVAAVERVTSQSFQIVIIDWDQQPEAGFLLKTARERKASERPLTLAIVSDDASVPKALQAGANSILRKPIMVNQVNDTLTTARDLLRAKQESATSAALAAAAGAATGSASSAVSAEPGSEKTLRAGEFLHPSGPAPGAQFDTESEMQKSLEQAAVVEVDPLKELEPMAASVAEETPTPAPPPPLSSEPRGLQWYLNTRAGAGTLPPVPAHAPPPPAPAKPELIGFEQTPANSADVADGIAPAAPPDHQEEHEQKAEAKLFAYIEGENHEAQESPRTHFSLGKRPIFAALLLAASAIVAAPQAPWHPQVRALLARGHQTVHAWLNPQPVTTAPAPESHENFGRAGDEYKLPVAETIPDATTDPSQIHVVPVVDPTAKKTNDTSANTEPTTGPGDAANTNPSDPPQPSAVHEQENPAQANPVQGSQPAQTIPDTPPSGQPTAGGTVPSPGATVAAPAAAEQPHSETPHVVALPPVATQPAPAKNSQPHYAAAPANVPSSLKSQMASMTPEASGNKPAEAAMQSIEPVAVPEATERALLTDQPAIGYPTTAKGQQGTVVLQVLIGRDGTVQDAKFMQGSLAFARTAIDGVKLWKFKPYSMNGRPVSIQTTMTMSFKPSS